MQIRPEPANEACGLIDSLRKGLVCNSSTSWHGPPPTRSTARSPVTPSRPGHKRRELAGLPHLPAGLQPHQTAQRNRRQDPGRGSRHQDTGSRQVVDPDTERRRRVISTRFRAVAYDSGRTLPHMDAKRQILGLDFAKNRSKITPNGHQPSIQIGFLGHDLKF